MPATESNDRIKALANLLVAADDDGDYDDYDDYDGDVGDDIMWSGTVRGKLELFETKNHKNIDSAVTVAAAAAALTSTGVEEAKVDAAANTPAAAGQDGAGAVETAASKKRAEVEAAAVSPPAAGLRRPLRSDDAKKFLCLVSKGCGHDRRQSSNQSRALAWLASRGVPHVVVDGMDPKARDVREELFAISGVRGNYPQFFVASSDGRAIEYFGDFDKMEILNETSGLPTEVLAMHPDLMTWEDITFGTATAAGGNGVRAQAGGAAVAAASTEAPASADIGMAATTATKTTTATTTATDHPSSDDSSSAVRQYPDQKMGAREVTRLKEGGAQVRTASARGNESEDAGDCEGGDDGSHDDDETNDAQRNLLQQPQSRLTFGCPDTYGAAGTGDVEYDYIPPVKERALAISVWEINKWKNGHQQASECQELYLSSSSSDAEDGSGGGFVGGNSGKELSPPRGHGVVGGQTSVDVKNRKHEKPPSFLAQFVESLNEDENDYDKENGGPEDGREHSHEMEKQEKNKGKLKERTKKGIKRAVRPPPPLDFLAQVEEHENTINGVEARALPPQTLSPRRRQALSPRNTDGSFFGANVALASSPSGSNKKIRGRGRIDARNKPPMSPRIINARSSPSASVVTANSSNVRGGGGISSPHGDNTIMTSRWESSDNCNNLQCGGILAPQGEAEVMQFTSFSRGGSSFQQDGLVENQLPLSLSLSLSLSSSSPSATTARTTTQDIVSPSIKLFKLDDDEIEDENGSFDTDDFCHNFEEKEDDEVVEGQEEGLEEGPEAAFELTKALELISPTNGKEETKCIVELDKSNIEDNHHEKTMMFAPVPAVSCISDDSRFTHVPQVWQHNGVGLLVVDGGGGGGGGGGGVGGVGGGGGVAQLKKMTTTDSVVVPSFSTSTTTTTATTTTTPIITSDYVDDDIVNEAMEFLKTSIQGCFYQEDSVVNDGEDLYYDIGHNKNTSYDKNDEKVEGDLLLAAARVALSLNRFLTFDDKNVDSCCSCKQVEDGALMTSMRTSKDGQNLKQRHQNQNQNQHQLQQQQQQQQHKHQDQHQHQHQHQHQEQQPKALLNDMNPPHESMIGKGGWKEWIKMPPNDNGGFPQSSAYTPSHNKKEDEVISFPYMIGTEKQQPVVPCTNAMSRSPESYLRIASSTTTSATVKKAVRQKPNIKICIEGAPDLDFNKPEGMFFVAAQPSPYGDDTSLFSGSSSKKKKKNTATLNPNRFFSNNNARALAPTRQSTEKYGIIHSAPRAEASSAHSSSTIIALSNESEEITQNVITFKSVPATRSMDHAPSPSSIYSVPTASRHFSHNTNMNFGGDHSENGMANSSYGGRAGAVRTKKGNKLLWRWFRSYQKGKQTTMAHQE